MAYYNESTVRNVLLAEIERYARVLQLNIVFDNPENNTYGELKALRDNLAEQYRERSFLKDAIEDYNKQS